MLRRGIFTLVVCVSIGWGLEASAGALNRIGGIGPRAGAMGGAYTAIADDASLFYYNPAGMAQFEAPYAEGGTDILFPIFHYDSAARGSADSNGGVFHVLPLMGYVHPLNDSITAGIGVYVPYGMGADFEHNPQALNFHTKSLTCLTHVSPGLALELNDELSLGLTLNIGYAQFRCKTPFDVAGHYLPMPTDSWGDGFGVGAGFGVLWAGDRVSLGAAYSTGSHADIDGATDMGAGFLRMRDGFSSSLDFPERASAGIAVRPTDRLELSFDTSWYGYTGDMDSMIIDFDTIPMKKTQTMDWEDNYALHTGLSYDLNDRWTVRTGYTYVEAVIPNETVSNLTPDMNGSNVSIGVECDKGPFTMSGFVLYSWGDRSVGSGLNKEEYGVDIVTVGCEAAWRF